LIHAVTAAGCSLRGGQREIRIDAEHGGLEAARARIGALHQSGLSSQTVSVIGSSL